MKQLTSTQIATMAAKARRALERPPFERIALLLQGGGALGSYQAGVYGALAEPSCSRIGSPASRSRDQREP
jgi:hypothetical protein